MKISKKRLALIRELETIIARSCYNGNIQNWGPNGNQQKEGRNFRYPITFTTTDGDRKGYHWASGLTAEQEMTGHYSFGANKLAIMQALNDALSYLQENHELNV